MIVVYAMNGGFCIYLETYTRDSSLGCRGDAPGASSTMSLLQHEEIYSRSQLAQSVPIFQPHEVGD